MGYVGNHGFINTGEWILLEAVTLLKAEVTCLKRTNAVSAQVIYTWRAVPFQVATLQLGNFSSPLPHTR